ncbi:MAG: DegT/DnrJ/EryC1/StrS family aminotransferase [Spirochaetes bacterium]|nr:DegT/DnrJ/EryC1/StrS family aminotransferase [Spirochaetota bacterium]
MIIPFHKPYIGEEEIAEVTETIKIGWITMGPKTQEFEKIFSEYIGAKYAVSVNSCTAALHLALRAIGIREGDEVIVPAMTFASTAEIILYFKARPVIADVDPKTHLLMPSEVYRKKTKKTKAVIAVHYGGQPVDMDALKKITGNSIRLIEDAAHALPAYYKDRLIGSNGEIVCFSFYATKTLTTGEGGMLTTRNKKWAERVKSLRLHGITSDAWKRYMATGTWKYDIREMGYKYNMTDINAAMGIAQLRKLQKMMELREKIAEKYNEAFSKIEEIIPYVVEENRKSAWHLYPLRIDVNKLKITRDEFVEKLKQRGIIASVHFIPLYRFSLYKKLGWCYKDFPGSEWIFKRTLSLPIYPGMTDEEINYVIENVIDIITKNRK